MIKRQSAQPARRISAADAAALVKSNTWIDYSAGLAQPDEFDAALALRREELTGGQDPVLPVNPAPRRGGM